MLTPRMALYVCMGYYVRGEGMSFEGSVFVSEISWIVNRYPSAFLNASMVPQYINH